MEDESDYYIKFVSDTLKQYRTYADRLTSDEHEIFPQDIQYLMAIYQSAKLGLLSLSHMKFRTFRLLKRKFTSWWNTKVSESRAELIANIPKGGKYPAVKDYTLQAEERYKDEFNAWQDQLQDAEDEYNFVEELRKDWSGFDKILTNLNYNMCSELRSLSMDREIKPRTREKKE